MPSPLVPDKIEDELEMTMVCHRPEGLEQLEAQTNFTKRELQVLYRGFKNVRWGRRGLYLGMNPPKVPGAPKGVSQICGCAREDSRARGTQDQLAASRLQARAVSWRPRNSTGWRHHGRLVLAWEPASA